MKKYICPLHFTMDMIGNKWKTLILFHLLEGPVRSGILQKKLPDISNKMFTQTIRDLEKDGFVERKIYPEVPPKVEYQLTALGKSSRRNSKIIRCMGERSFISYT